MNGVNTNNYWQFSTEYSTSLVGKDRLSYLIINNPVALRGYTEIKCTAFGVSGKFRNYSKL